MGGLYGRAMDSRGAGAVLSAMLGLAAAAACMGPNCAAQEERPAAVPQSSLDEVVVVTATRSEKELDEAPGVAAVITRGALVSRGVRTADQALNVVPGVFNRRGKGLMDTQAAITLRGFPSQQRTLIMLDGIPMNDSYTGGVQFGGLAAENIERIEVVKGPFSSLYGGSAMGGVVNVITRMPAKRELTMSGGFGGGLGNRGAMNDLARAHFAYGETIKGKLGIRVSYGRNRSNGYANDLNSQAVRPPEGVEGYRTTTDTQGNPRFVLGDRGDNTWEDQDFSVKAVYSLSAASRLTLSMVTSGYAYGTDSPHTYLRDAAGNPVYAFTSGKSTVREATFLSGAGSRRQDIYSVSFETKVGGAQMKSSLGVLDVNRSWYTTPGSTAETTGRGGPGTLAETPVSRTTANVHFTLPAFGRHLLTAGTDVTGNSARTREFRLTNWRDERSRSAQAYEARGKSLSGGFYLQDEVLLRHDLTAYLGARGDYWRTYEGYAGQADTPGLSVSPPGRGALSFSPKIAVVYRLSGATALKSSAGRVFRPPTVYELYRTWSSSSGVIYRANPLLDPETAVSWDIAFDRTLWKGAGFSGAYFENRMSNLVYRRTSPSDSKINEYVNAGKARGRGVEMALGQRVTEGLKFYANGTFNNARITENEAKRSIEGKMLTFLPRWTGNAGVDVEKGRVTVALTGRYVSKAYTQDENRDVVSNVPGSYDPHFTADARVIYRINGMLALSYSVENILDRRYFYSYLAPRRSSYAELLLTWIGD